MNDTEQKRKLKHLLRSYAYREGDFTLSSGRKTKHYVNCKPVILRGDGLDLVSNMLLRRISVSSNCVAGLTLGADPLVSGVALAAWTEERILNALIVRKEAKGHGTGAWIEGPLPLQGQRVTILEDVVTTGGSYLKAVDKIRDAGYNVERIICIVDRQEHNPFTFYDAGIELISLFTLEDFKCFS